MREASSFFFLVFFLLIPFLLQSFLPPVLHSFFLLSFFLSFFLRWCRRCYWLFEAHFPDLARGLTADLDSYKLKLLNEAKGNSSQPSSRPSSTEPDKSRLNRRRSTSTPMHKDLAGVKLDAPPAAAAAAAPSAAAAAATPRANSLLRTFGSADDLHSTYPPAKNTPASHLRTPSSKAQRVQRPTSARSGENLAAPQQSARRVQSAASTRVSPGTAYGSHMPRRVSRTPTSSAPTSPRLARMSTASGGAASSSVSDTVSEILTRSASTDWSERNEAVAMASALLCSDARFSSRDLKKLSEYYIRQFAEPHKKVLPYQEKEEEEEEEEEERKRRRRKERKKERKKRSGGVLMCCLLPATGVFGRY